MKTYLVVFLNAGEVVHNTSVQAKAKSEAIVRASVSFGSYKGDQISGIDKIEAFPFKA